MGLTLRVDKHGLELSNVRFRILRGLQSGMNVTDLARVRKVSRASLYKVINSLISTGLLERIDKSYSLTTRGIEDLHSLVGLRYNLRQHNFHVKFKVLEHPKNWDKKRNEFRKLKMLTNELQAYWQSV